MREKIEWSVIEEPYVYGFLSRNGNRRCNVVRAYESTWLVFFYVDDKQIKNPYEGPRKTFNSSTQAQAFAKSWLTSHIKK